MDQWESRNCRQGRHRFLTGVEGGGGIINFCRGIIGMRTNFAWNCFWEQNASKVFWCLKRFLILEIFYVIRKLRNLARYFSLPTTYLPPVLTLRLSIVHNFVALFLSTSRTFSLVPPVPPSISPLLSSPFPRRFSHFTTIHSVSPFVLAIITAVNVLFPSL